MNLVWRQFSHVHPLGWPSSRPSILVFTICCPHLGFASKGQNTTKNNIWVCLKIGYSPKWLFQEGKRWLSSRFRPIFRPRYIPNIFPIDSPSGSGPKPRAHFGQHRTRQQNGRRGGEWKGSRQRTDLHVVHLVDILWELIADEYTNVPDDTHQSIPGKYINQSYTVNIIYCIILYCIWRDQIDDQAVGETGAKPLKRMERVQKYSERCSVWSNLSAPKLDY